MKDQVIIDVRESDEFEAEHIPGSIHIPLARFERTVAQTIAQLPSDCEIVIMCRSGKRAAMAMDQISKLKSNAASRASVFEGGILKWKELNRPTQTKKANHFPIMRQVQLIAGLLMIVSVIFGYWVSPSFLLIGGFVGLGLTTAGATGFCGMARLLAHAPWNRISNGDGV